MFRRGGLAESFGGGNSLSFLFSNWLIAMNPYSHELHARNTTSHCAGQSVRLFYLSTFSLSRKAKCEGLTDGRTDTVNYIVACSRLKILIARERDVGEKTRRRKFITFTGAIDCLAMLLFFFTETVSYCIPIHTFKASFL